MCVNVIKHVELLDENILMYKENPKCYLFFVFFAIKRFSFNCSIRFCQKEKTRRIANTYLAASLFWFLLGFLNHLQPMHVFRYGINLFRKIDIGEFIGKEALVPVTYYFISCFTPWIFSSTV